MRTSKACRMRSVSLIASVLALASSASIASDAPALEVFKKWLSAYNSGSEARIASFWEQYGNQQPDDRVALDIRRHSATGDMTLVRVAQKSPKHMVAILKEGRGAFSESTVDLVSASPPAVARIVGHPIPSPATLPPQATSDADLARNVRKFVATTKGANAFSGVIFIAHHDQVVLNQAWGFADSERRIPNSVDTQFGLASMNKMFTAISVLQLANQGKLHLDDFVIKYLPDYPNQELAKTVTVRELLSHTGGTGDYLTPEFTTHKSEMRTLSDYVHLFGSRPGRFKPGTRFEYSNYGYILLGRVVEVVSAQTYDQYVRDHILNIAGMRHTGPIPDGHRSVAIGYSRTRNGLQPTEDMFHLPASSGGGWYSDAHDLYRFAAALRSGTLLSPSLLNQALTWTSIHPAYGLGFFLLPGLGYGHSGSSPGCSTELHILPDQYVVIVLANRDPPMATDMNDVIAAILPRGANRVTIE
ncbi:beta-lactamase family protein [Acidobacteria bacterium AB60]|nr:beta-lactamase family protein [Acidobacteria bacterium AB60]